MKALRKKLLPLILFGIAVTSLFSVQPAQAYKVMLEQMGANVVATGSGAINLTGLNFLTTADASGSRVIARFGAILTGPASSIGLYSGLTGPTSFGSGSISIASTGSGDFVGIDGFQQQLFVPQGYVSGTALSDNAIYDNATFASLGVTPGTYKWTWGTGLPNQNFTLIIGRAGVPDGGSTVSLLGCALLGLAALRRRLGC
jgi:hypothetical protein